MNPEQTILKSYYKILEGNGIPQYKQSKYKEVIFNSNDPLSSLWEIHKTSINDSGISESIPNQSLLDLKFYIAKNLFSQCCYCEHQCGINRNYITARCKVGKASISSEFMHLGEEESLIPSHTIFFSGCTLSCVFCQNWDISQQIKGCFIEPKQLASIIMKRILQGSRNVNWVGGDPTPNLLYILEVLQYLDENIAQVWNSNMYCSIETMYLLNGIVDLYLTDFKFGNNQCAKRLAKIDSYLEVIQRNHKIAYQQGEMIIRHLVLPNHVECCSKPIIDWIAMNTPHVLVNIMGQYRPEYMAKDFKDISQVVSSEEIRKVKIYAKSKNLQTL